ncbi:MAG: efflux RND transporter periplasmic adaptor subunit [Bacteroidales bacterium]
MKTLKQPVKILFTYAFVALTLLSVSCSNSKEKEAKATREAEKKTELVKVMELQLREVARTVEYTSTLQAFEEIHMTPAAPGRIDAIPVEVGSRVTKGALLVQMDRTQLHQAEVQLKNLEADFRRLDTLQKVGSIARQQYDQLKTQYDIAKSNVEFLKQNTRLIAPFSGVISGKYFEAGEMYSGAPNPMTGKAAIVSLVQIDRLKVLVPISEKFFPLIKTGMEAKVVSDIYPDKSFTGKVFRIHPTIDPGSRSFNIEIVITNAGGTLRPGMFTRVSLDLDKVEALLIPANAVLKMQGSNERYLFLEKNGTAKRVSVTMGRRYNDLVEVFADELSKGDRVIVTGQARLLDGATVKVVD